MPVEPAGAERLRAVPAPPPESLDPHAGWRTVLRWGLCACLLWAPLPFASVQPGAVLALECAAAALGAIALVVIARGGRGELPPLLVASLAGVMVLVGVIQVLPLFAPSASIPGGAERQSVAAFIGDALPSHIAWSASAAETVDATARLAAYVLFGLCAVIAVRTRRHALEIAVVLVAAAVFQSIYGCAEYLSGSNAIFGYAKKHYLDSATGTFVNRNHFAGALALALPFAFAATSELRSKTGSAGGRAAWTAIGAAVVLVLWIGVLLSQSRAGLAVSLAAVAIYVLAGGMRSRAVRGIAALLGLAVVFVLWNDVRVPAERFARLEEDFAHPAGRLAVWRESLAIVRDHAGLGYGLGTFDTVYNERTALVHASGRYDHAHNDHLQAILEAGLPAYLALLAMVALAALPAVRQRRDSVFAAAALAATAALALHACVDFPLRIPAIAVWGTVIAALLMMNGHTVSPRRLHAATNARDPRLDPDRNAPAPNRGLVSTRPASLFR